jgi:hypothetical protein
MRPKYTIHPLLKKDLNHVICHCISFSALHVAYFECPVDGLWVRKCIKAFTDRQIGNPIEKLWLPFYQQAPTDVEQLPTSSFGYIYHMRCVHLLMGIERSWAQILHFSRKTCKWFTHDLLDQILHLFAQNKKGWLWEWFFLGPFQQDVMRWVAKKLKRRIACAFSGSKSVFIL